MQKVKFSTKNKSEMFSLMKFRIDEHFKRSNTSQFANAAMKFKIILWLSLWVVTIVAVYFTRGNPLLTFTIGFLHMFTQVMIAFNIAHDANHGSVFANGKYNRWLAYSMDLIGCNSELWRFNHNQQHHTFVNVDGHDNSVEGYGLFRFCPTQPHFGYQRFQHLYAPLLYSISTLNYVTIKDFKLLKQYVQTNGGKNSVTTAFMVRFFAWKIFYFLYLIVLPIFVFKLSVPAVILFFILGHVLNGALLAFIFQTGHITIGTSFPQVHNHTIDKNWAVHIVETTGDYAPKSFLLQWLCGAINIHVIHHLFPKICHTHYRAITPIIKQTVKEFGYEFREFPSFYNALASHLNELKILGQPDMVVEANIALPVEARA